jgi:CubicO group peptidase (beta-lactamase class C family)
VAWWSFSKTVIAAAALVLLDHGKLELDGPVPRAPYTLRHLLQHTSGLPDYGSDPA